MNVNKVVEEFGIWYGDGMDGSCAQADQWARILQRAPSQSIVLVNFFKLRETAIYDSDHADSVSVSGQKAFERYSTVSIPAMERAGGTFLLVAPFQGSFVGKEEDWDMLVVGSYPNLEAFLNLHRDEKYRSAYHHRSAACERQKVLVCGG